MKAINPVMHTGLRYGGDDTPVPRKTYRCKATAAEPDKLAHTHPCKLTADHDETDHVCICGKRWEPVPA